MFSSQSERAENTIHCFGIKFSLFIQFNYLEFCEKRNYFQKCMLYSTLNGLGLVWKRHVWEVGEEGAGSGIPKVEGSGRKREKLRNIAQYFAIE